MVCGLPVTERKEIDLRPGELSSKEENLKVTDARRTEHNNFFFQVRRKPKLRLQVVVECIFQDLSFLFFFSTFSKGIAET